MSTPMKQHKEDEGQEGLRKAYCKPELNVLGDLRSLTLGGSPGFLDSGSESTRQPPGPPPPG